MWLQRWPAHACCRGPPPPGLAQPRAHEVATLLGPRRSGAGAPERMSLPLGRGLPAGAATPAVCVRTCVVCVGWTSAERSSSRPCQARTPPWPPSSLQGARPGRPGRSPSALARPRLDHTVCLCMGWMEGSDSGTSRLILHSAQNSREPPGRLVLCCGRIVRPGVYTVVGCALASLARRGGTVRVAPGLTRWALAQRGKTQSMSQSP